MRNFLVLLLLIGSSLILGGPFVTDVAAQAANPPMLWGVDEDDNQLFSIDDYTQIGNGAAAAGLVDHGRLRYDRGNGHVVDLPLVVSPGGRITGGHIGSIALDPQGIAYMALNAGLEFDDPTANLSAPVLLRFDTALASPIHILDVVEIVGQINIPGFNEEVNADNISGLSFDPLSGDLYALYRVGSKKFNPGVDQLLKVSPADATIDPVFGLKEMRGQGEFQGQAITDGEDLEFDTAGNLYVTDDQDDHLHLINKSTGAIIGIVDNDVVDGLTGSGPLKVEALAWDPVLNQMVSSATLRQLFFIETFQNGNNIPLGELLGLTDVEALDFIIPGNPAIDIRKQEEGEDTRTFPSGSEVTFTIVVTNIGDVPLTNVNVTDLMKPTDSLTPDVPAPQCNKSNIGNPAGVFAPGDVDTYECVVTSFPVADPPTGVLEGFTNEACVTGNPIPNIDETVGDCDPSTVEVSGIDIEKLTNGEQADGPNDADVPQIAAGDPVTWRYLVTNTGDAPINEADVVVEDQDLPGGTDIVLVDQGDGNDTVLSPDETWIYEATGVAENLSDPPAGLNTVDGCGTSDQPAYENMGKVTVPDATDSDPSHYCNPPGPDIDIEKFTNGEQADGPNDTDVPQITAGDTVTWRYVVTNTGDVAFHEDNISVVDDIIGAVTNIVDRPAGMVLSPGETWIYEVEGVAENLSDPPAGLNTVDGCGTSDRPAYENMGKVTAVGSGIAATPVEDIDASHYCNPPVGEPNIDIEKWTKIVAAPAGGNICDKKNKENKPKMFTFRYTGDNVLQHSQAEGKVKIKSGELHGESPVFIEAKDFKGEVQLGGSFDTEKGQIKFKDLNGKLLKELDIHTSCSQPMVLGDQYGGVQLIGFITKDGKRTTFDATPGSSAGSDFGVDADTPDEAPQGEKGEVVVWTYFVKNIGVVPLHNVVVTDDILGAITDIVAREDGNDDDLLDPGERWLYQATGKVQALELYKNVGHVAGVDSSGTEVTDEDPSHYKSVVPQVNICEAKGKLKTLTMRYTGDNVEDHSQDNGKVIVDGDPGFAAVVHIVSSEKKDGTGNKYFDGEVSLGEQFVIDGTIAKLKSNTIVLIQDQDGGLLQTIEFHTSCSQPLERGNQFGGIQLVDASSQ